MKTKTKLFPLFIPAVMAMAVTADSSLVQSEPSGAAMEQWQQETTAALNRWLARAPSLERRRPNEAIVQVAFTVNDLGQADDIRLLPGSGNWSANSAARYAVERLDTLGSMPASTSGQQRLLANIIFFRTEKAREQLLRELDRSERLRLSSFSAERDYLAIGNLATTAAG